MKQNIIPKYRYSIRRAQREADVYYNQPALLSRDAFLGDNNGRITEYQGSELQPGYVVVRDMSGNLSIAYNQRVPLVPGLAIKVGYDSLQPVLFQVLSVRDYLLENPALGVPAHHEKHEFPSNDTVFVSSFQFLPGMIYTGEAGFIVTLYPFFFKKADGSRGYMRAQTLDLSSYVPTTGAQAFTICVNDDNGITVVAGSTSGGIGTLTISNFPTILDPTLHEIWGVRLYAGMADVAYTDCYDFRFGGIGGAGSGPSSDVPVVVLGVARWSAVAGMDTFDFPDVVYEIQGIQVNGVTQDPISYSLSNLNQTLVLDTPLAYDAIVTANYTIEVL